MTAILAARAVGVTFTRGDRPVEALRDLSLDVTTGRIVVALGPSGCGKSTLLSLFAGFARPTQGQVLCQGVPIAGPGADRAVVFQDDALMPWLNAADNVAFGLRMRAMPRAERRALADAWLARVGLEGMGDRAIASLSGGMRQRVGLARALAVAPRFVLLDEPLGALDELTRERMQALLLRLWQASLDTTPMGMFVITHSIEEALLLAHDLVLMSPRPGRIVHRLNPGFVERFQNGEPLRTIKADARFRALREELALEILTAEEQAEADD